MQIGCMPAFDKSDDDDHHSDRLKVPITMFLYISLAYLLLCLHALPLTGWMQPNKQLQHHSSNIVETMALATTCLPRQKEPRKSTGDSVYL